MWEHDALCPFLLFSYSFLLCVRGGFVVLLKRGGNGKGEVEADYRAV